MKELVIGIVGYAGSFSEKFTGDLQHLLKEKHGFKVFPPVKFSTLIEKQFSDRSIPKIRTGSDQGSSTLERAKVLQDLGDDLRKEKGNAILASLAIRKIIELRGGAPKQDDKNAFILDSLKHHAEVELLREVYGDNFKLLAVHCSRDNRVERLKEYKFRHADESDIKSFMLRDEKDETKLYGQEVRKVFHIADYFVNNNQKDDGVLYATDLKRFLELLLGKRLTRPKHLEAGMYHAYAASLKSACLSRQVGAALQADDGRIISVGTNEAPRFGGGVYSEDHEGTPTGDHRCFKWKTEELPLPYCHNTRKKKELKRRIADWLGEELSEGLAEHIFPPSPEGELPLRQQERENAIRVIKSFLIKNYAKFDEMPGVGDLIEYSRSIHAEMDAILNAARSGISPQGCFLYTTTFPCHNCARHIVAAGIREVYYMEPYIKSLAKELHSDALVHESEEKHKVLIRPFTGVGPRMYEAHFLKASGIKDDTSGEYKESSIDDLRRSSRLLDLGEIERRAAHLSNGS